MNDKPQTDVIVIGGGLAGLVAARDLQEFGFQTVVLDARSRLGGRLFTRPFADTDLMVEFGGQYLSLDYQKLMVAEIERYGVTTEPSPDLISNHSLIGGERRNSVLPIPVEQVPDVERAALHCVRAADRINPYLPLNIQGLDDLDISWAEFLAPLNLPAATLDFLSMFAAFYAIRPSENTSALFLLQQLALVGNSPWNFFAIGHHRFADGSKALIDGLAADCGEIRLECPVSGVIQHDDHIEVRTAKGETLTASRAVLAIPMNCWNDIVFQPQLSEAKRSASAGQHSSVTSGKYWALVDNNEIDSVMAGPSSTRGLINLSREYDMRDGTLKVGFVCDPSEYDFNTIEGVQKAVDMLSPGTKVLKHDAHDWNTDPFSKGAWFGPQPGLLARSHAEMSKPEHRIAFAGSDVAISFMGWMEGAMETAHRAAFTTMRGLGGRAFSS